MSKYHGGAASRDTVQAGVPVSDEEKAFKVPLTLSRGEAAYRGVGDCHP